MAEDKTIEKGKTPQPPAGELSEKEIDKVSGGFNPQPDPPGMTIG